MKLNEIRRHKSGTSTKYWPQHSHHRVNSTKHCPQHSHHGADCTKHWPQRCHHGVTGTKYWPQHSHHGADCSKHWLQRYNHGVDSTKHWQQHSQHGADSTKTLTTIRKSQLLNRFTVLGSIKWRTLQHLSHQHQTSPVFCSFQQVCTAQCWQLQPITQRTTMIM